MIEIYKEFSFDAAHHLGSNFTTKHANARMHGHSFTVRVYLRGTPDEKKGWIMEFEAFEATLEKVRTQLDHQCLNTIKGLEVPTMENLTQWIWEKLKPELPALHRITTERGTRGEGCSYEG